MIALLLAAGLLNHLCAQQKPGLKVLTSYPVAGGGGWDYIQVGPVNDWLYVSHSTQVNILNKKNGDSVGVIENTPGVHGIAFDVNNSKGFTSNGGANAVTVFNMNDNRILDQVAVGQNPDAIMYEPFSKKIITCNGRGKSLSIIDPVDNKLVATLALSGKPETAVSDDAGKMYINIEDKNSIAVVDTKTFKVLQYWSIAPGDGPSGLAIDKVSKRLFAGCDKLLMVIDAANGKVLDKVVIGDGCDGVAFDAATKLIYSSNGDGTLTVIREDADKFTVVENVETKRSARTLALDPSSHLVYLPAGEFEKQLAGERWPKLKPGTFQILVVGDALPGK